MIWSASLAANVIALGFGEGAVTGTIELGKAALGARHQRLADPRPDILTIGRAKVVDLTVPYCYGGAAIAVPVASTVQTLADLNGGKTFCVGTATIYEQWLNGTLEIIDPTKATPPTDPQVVTLPTDNECIQAVDAGRKYDAIVSSPVALDNAVKNGPKIRILGIPWVLTVSAAFALDKGGPDDKALLELLNTIIDEMHADGTLSRLSIQWLGYDRSVKPN